ncbi:hypothetical protein C5167_036438 [Papaver somniferum]|uniref:Uncharacterized protein n=1 Tax=Papaver somniferum TaxID=3469 RepID=A0A4Y7I6N0_PAPSO|nr:hypothetical protein C5167_036438 [Papaver somniferum]
MKGPGEFFLHCSKPTKCMVGLEIGDIRVHAKAKATISTNSSATTPAGRDRRLSNASTRSRFRNT